MHYLAALISALVLIFVFRKVRAYCISFATAQKRKNEAIATANATTRSWKKLSNIRDVRPERDRRIESGETYTSYTGRYKTLTDGVKHD